jgi:AbrB family looped-hinge helix DNA binding protein
MAFDWYFDAMETTIDASGRVVVPKALRDALGLVPGTTLDVSAYGSALTLVPKGRTAVIVEEDGRLVADSDQMITDDQVFGLLDAARR